MGDEIELKMAAFSYFLDCQGDDMHGCVYLDFRTGPQFKLPIVRYFGMASARDLSIDLPIVL